MVKIATDIFQSKKLAEILPIESADMYYNLVESKIPNFIVGSHSDYRCYIPCWSLASLLEQLKSEIRLENKQILYLHLNKYDDTDYEIRYTNSWTGEVLITEADNLIDACVAMIEKLNELKML